MDALKSATAELSSLIGLAADQLPRLTDTATRTDGHWSRKEILGHLIDSAANNHQRFVRGQLDRELTDLVQLWLAYNRHLLHLMSNVAPERLDSVIRITDHDPMSLQFVMID